MSIKAMKQALEALEDARDGTRIEYNDHSAYQDEITALRQAIEQAEKWDTSDMAHRSGGLTVEQNEWVGLTDEEIDAIGYKYGAGGLELMNELTSKLKEKNT